MPIDPLTAIDFYKADHRRQYPTGTTEVYSNFTARKARPGYGDEVIFFGLQYFIQDFLIDSWGYYFFNKPKSRAVADYKRLMKNAIGSLDISHIEALHDLGYLPLVIKALPEGKLVPTGIPLLTIRNTHPDFFWLTNYIETILSCYLWKPTTSATQAFRLKKLLTTYADTTGAPHDFVKFQAHDFSFRGMSGYQDAVTSGAGHLTSFVGTDTVAAIDFVESYYGADSSNELVGVSVPATEHSVMCMGTLDGELQTFKRLITDLYPTGIVSIVSDTWDFWKVLTEYSVTLKEDILKRDGKVVFRPDSGNPHLIICGDPYAVTGSPESKGAVEVLWDIFGGTINEKGYKELNPKVGLIYGDSIFYTRAQDILRDLAKKGFASTNIVFGIGSYTYEYVTRDTYGFAMKATSGVVNGQRRDIFKNPKTDDGTKKSAKGLLTVYQDEKGPYLTLAEGVSEGEEARGCLKIVFKDGEPFNYQTLETIRKLVDHELDTKIWYEDCLGKQG